MIAYFFFKFKLKHTVTYIGIWRKNHHSKDQNYTKQFSGLFTVFRLVIFIYEIFLEFLNLFWLIPKTKNIASTNWLLFWRPCISNVYKIKISLQKVAIYNLLTRITYNIIIISYITQNEWWKVKWTENDYLSQKLVTPY